VAGVGPQVLTLRLAGLGSLSAARRSFLRGPLVAPRGPIEVVLAAPHLDRRSRDRSCRGECCEQIPVSRARTDRWVRRLRRTGPNTDARRRPSPNPPGSALLTMRQCGRVPRAGKRQCVGIQRLGISWPRSGSGPGPSALRPLFGGGTRDGSGTPPPPPPASSASRPRRTRRPRPRNHGPRPRAWSGAR